MNFNTLKRHTMLNKKDIQKEKILLLLKQKGNLEFLITTFFISLLTILGVFMSHYNCDKFIGRVKVYETVVTPVNPTDKVIGEVSNKAITITFNKKQISQYQVDDYL